jgi:hypothetical protein
MVLLPRSSLPNGLIAQLRAPGLTGLDSLTAPEPTVIELKSTSSVCVPGDTASVPFPADLITLPGPSERLAP